MKPLILKRTVIICLVGVCDFFACDSSASQNEVPDTRSQFNMTATITHNSSTVPKKNYSLNDNNTEARTGPEVSLIRQMSKDLIDTGHFLESKIPIEHKLPESPLHVKTLLGEEDWRTLLGTTDVSWNSYKETEEIYSHYLRSGVSPQELFYIMNVHLPHFPDDVRRIDPKVFAWFKYIIYLRDSHAMDDPLANVGDMVAHDTVTHDAATSHMKFNNEDLFSFLVDIYSFQPIPVQTTLAVAISDSPYVYSLKQVVELFELLRQGHESDLKKLAEEMQRPLLLRADTVELVLNAWKINMAHPEDTWYVFSLLKNSNMIDLNLFNLWLRYVQLYWKHVKSTLGVYPYLYKDIDAFLKQQLSIQQMTAVLSSKAFYHLLTMVFTCDVSKIARSWNLKILIYGTTPKQYFKYLFRSPMSSIDDKNFMPAIQFIGIYKKRAVELRVRSSSGHAKVH
ncbi:hypothetical protein Plhal304r1_c016g0058961 [Plasmopara halstedii]